MTPEQIAQATDWTFYAAAALGALIVIGCIALGVHMIVESIRNRRKRRRLKLLHSSQPYDARFTNSVAAQDWRDIERAMKHLRPAA